MRKCIFLGNKNGDSYCRKPNDKACPSGQIRSCPCIPPDFWNVETIQKVKSIPADFTKEEYPNETVRTDADSRKENTKKTEQRMPVRELRIFKP